jgi:hypothetical protein
LSCLYALASEATGRSDLCTQAARVLLKALAADLPGRTLWAAAEKDPQLRVMHRYLPGFKAELSERTGTELHDGSLSLDIEKIIEKTFHVSS